MLKTSANRHAILNLKNKVVKQLLLLVSAIVFHPVGASGTDLSPKPSLMIRYLALEQYLADIQKDPSCCPFGYRVYLFPPAIDYSMPEIAALMKVDKVIATEKSELSIDGLKVAHYHEQADRANDAYYIKAAEGNNCIGYVLLEPVPAEDLEIDRLLQHRGFNLVPLSDFKLRAAEEASFRMYEKRESAYIERLIIAQLAVEGPDPTLDVVYGEMFYPEAMEAAFNRIVAQWLNQQFELRNQSLP